MRIGENQLSCLKNFSEFRTWTLGSGNGWVWANTSTTKRILDSLVKKGLLELKGNTYSITAAGKELIETKKFGGALK